MLDNLEFHLIGDLGVLLLAEHTTHQSLGLGPNKIGLARVAVLIVCDHHLFHKDVMGVFGQNALNLHIRPVENKLLPVLESDFVGSGVHCVDVVRIHAHLDLELEIKQ